MDGNYPSFLPIPKTNKYLFAHVVKSQLMKSQKVIYLIMSII